MKKILLLTFVGTMIAAASAFGHCGACGTEGKAHGEKACCSEKAGECCKKADKDGCKSECKAASDCTKACDATEKAEKAAEKTAAAPSACCPATKAAKAA